MPVAVVLDTSLSMAQPVAAGATGGGPAGADNVGAQPYRRLDIAKDLVGRFLDHMAVCQLSMGFFDRTKSKYSGNISANNWCRPYRVWLLACHPLTAVPAARLLCHTNIAVWLPFQAN